MWWQNMCGDMRTCVCESFLLTCKADREGVNHQWRWQQGRARGKRHVVDAVMTEKGCQVLSVRRCESVPAPHLYRRLVS